MKREGILLSVTDEHGRQSQGEVSPLPNWNQESIENVVQQIHDKKEELLSVEWSSETIFPLLLSLNLYPSLSFGLEATLLNLLSPVNGEGVKSSAWLMGTPSEILSIATQRKAEGFSTAKVKVSKLSLQEAYEVINQLKELFKLRIDVNRAWSTQNSLHFFSQFPHDAFDYVEEPFQNPLDLPLFKHPLAVDESFPHPLCLESLEKIPSLKALIYKPTVQGGISHCLPIKSWCEKRGVDLVLSSSFEGHIGHSQIAMMAKRLSLKTAVGIGTSYYLEE